MRHTAAILGLVAITAASLSACGGGKAAAMPPPVAASQSLDTAQVLAQAMHLSETSSPYPVNDGALVLNDTSDTGEPISINGT